MKNRIEEFFIRKKSGHKTVMENDVVISIKLLMLVVWQISD